MCISIYASVLENEDQSPSDDRHSHSNAQANDVTDQSNSDHVSIVERETRAAIIEHESWDS